MADPPAGGGPVTVADLAHFAETFADLDDPEVMRHAWPGLRHARSWTREVHQDEVGEPYDAGVRFADVTRLLAALERHGVRYALIGSMAMAARGVVRATQDIDFFVDPDPDNVARLRQALRSVFDDDSIDEITSEDLAGSYPVVRYGPPDGDGVIDIVGRLGETYTYEDIESDKVEVEGVAVSVATPRMLYEMKRNTLRPQDRADAEALRTRFNLEE